MGRKSRLKRERAQASPTPLDVDVPASPASLAPVSDVDAEPQGAIEGGHGHERRSRTVGARVARVAVDDATWAAFRELCGSTPASIRLGELVAAEVRRAHNPEPEPDPVAAVKAIRAHVDELEVFIRGAAPRPSLDAAEPRQRRTGRG